MITTPQNGVSPPLSAIKQTLIFYEAKCQAEEEKTAEFERLLNESRAKRDRYRIMVAELMADQESTEVPPPPDSGIGLSATDTANPLQEVPPASKSGDVWIKPDVSWLDLIRKAIRHEGGLVTNQDVANFLGMSDEARKLHHQTLSGSMAAYRSTGQLVGIPVFKPTPNGKTINQYFTGLPEFFEDVDTKQLKPEFKEQLTERGKRHSFFLTEAEALASQKANPLSKS